MCGGERPGGRVVVCEVAVRLGSVAGSGGMVVGLLGGRPMLFLFALGAVLGAMAAHAVLTLQATNPGRRVDEAGEGTGATH